MEAVPQIRIVCMSDTEERRLWDWIFAHSEYRDLLERALELGDETPAA